MKYKVGQLIWDLNYAKAGDDKLSVVVDADYQINPKGHCILIRHINDLTSDENPVGRIRYPDDDIRILTPKEEKKYRHYLEMLLLSYDV